MTTSRRVAPLPLLLIGLLALLALGGVVLWSTGPTPAEAQTVSRILVSNVGQSNNERVDLDGNDHAQLFHTAASTEGWALTSLIVVSEDTQGDDFDVDICEAHNSTEFPTSTCTRLSRPGSFAAGSLEFTHPGINLNANDNYVVVFKQAGNEDVSLDATTSGGEDSTGLSGWSIKNRFDWKDGGTWKHKGGSSNEAILITVKGYEGHRNHDATGRPVILYPVDEAGILYAHTLDIADEDGIPFSGSSDTTTYLDKYHYKWIRVDGDTETHIGADSSRYRIVDADTGKLIKVEVSFADHAGNAERVTSKLFGPITEPAPLPSPTTLVGNTGQPVSATVANITEEYAMGFTLGDHGQGYEISSVSIDLAAAPSDLTVSLWMGKHSGSGQGGSRVKLFDFENPASFQAGLNEFTAPAGAFAYHGVEYFIALSDFGASLSINETTSNNEDAGGEPGAELADSAGGDTNVLRLAVKGSRRDSGILVSNFAQPGEGDQEVISLGDKCCFKMDVGNADRYLIRGFSWTSDDTTSRNGGWRNPFELHEGSSTGVKDGDDTRRLTMYNTRNNEGVAARTAPLGATVAGGSRTYTFLLDVDLGVDGTGTKIERLDAVLIRNIVPAADGEDSPGAAGFDLSAFGDAEYPDAPYVTVFGEPLYAMTSNLGQSDNGFASLGGANAKVFSQGFSTGPDEDGYDLLGIGVEIEGSAAQVPDGPTSVSVAVHAQSGGKPGAKLFDLISPTEYAAGHSFFEAPRGTKLEANTTYVLVWVHNGGTWHRLQRTLGDGEDSGSLTRFWVSDSYYRGADLDNLTEDSNSNALQIAVYTNTPPPGNATGRPVILSPVDEARVLYAHTLDIADADGIPFSGASDTFNVFNKYTYRWIRVDGDADIGKLIKVEVSFEDDADNAESVTSLPFGPITEPAPLPSPTTLVGNTGQPVSATATADITEEYAMGFTLGDHGQGYEIASVSIDLAAAPSDLTVSLWMGKHSGSGQGGSRVKLFDFENPSSFRTRLNEFTAPAGAFAYHGVEYFITLSDFGASLSINETTSNNEDAGGETGATLADSAGGDTNVLRLAVKGSRRDSGILVSNFAQPGEGDQEIISLGDKCCFKMDVGNADRYLIRGFSWTADDTTTRQGGHRNPFELHEGSSTGVEDGDDTRRLTMYNTRNNEGVTAHTAPLGATVAGGSKTYTFLLDLNLGRDGEGNKIERIDAVLTRNVVPAADGEDSPGAAGFDLSGFGDAAYPDAPYVTVFGEPLVAMTSNFGQTNNGFHSLGSASTTVASQAFTTGSDEFGYRLQGFGVNIEGSDADGDPQVPDGPTFVSVAVHAQSGGKPGAKLFDLVSPTEYAPGHSFFEAPPGTHLAPSTSYVLVWRHNGGTWHRLQRTTSDGEDSGARAMFWISDSLYRGADLDNLAADPDSNALEIAVYGEVNTGSEVFALSPGVTVSSDALSVNEGGSGSYTVVLDAEPTASVTVDVTGGGDVTVEPASLTFTADNWKTARTVTVRAAADDNTADDAQTITHTMASGSASEYVGLSVDSVAVTVTDDDEPEVTVSRDTLSLVEGSSGSYTVRLAFQPSTRVTVDVTGGGDVTVTPTSLTFSTTNWATAQTVTVRAAEDNDAVDDSQTVTHAVASTSAPEYAGLSIDSVAVTVTDNDAPGVSVSRSTLRVNEGGSGTYTVRLASQPTAGVTINVAGGGGVTVVPTSLTFSTSTWNTPQTVTVRAAEDADTADDAQTVTHTVDSNSAPEYAGLSVRSVAVTVTDNDDPEVTVSFAQESYTVSEGSSVTVRVRLSTAPRRTVDIPLTTVNLGGASAADYSGVPSSVRFQGGAVVGSFTFSAVLDNVDDVGESVRIGFGTLPALVTAGAANEATVSIANLDPVVPNRAPTASATAEPNTVYPGDFVTLDGTASDPDGDALTFRWTSDGGGDFFTGAGLLDAAWIAPATETTHTVNLTLTVTDPHGLIASVTVSVIVEPLPQPNPATDVHAVVSDDNSVVFTWTIPGQPRDVTIDNVQVQQRDNRGAFEVPTWDTVVTLAGAGTHTTVNGLADDTEYVFRIRLTTTHGLFADTRYIRVRTLTGAPSPRHFSASGPTQTSITLDWFTVETAAEYKLEYRKDGETEWNGISGDFDHLPSTMDHRQAFGVAAGLDCNTRYDFRVSARGSGETRNDGRRYPSTLFGSYATTSARTGECAQGERVTNLLVSVEPSCATLTWTPPSGDRDTGYRVERYSHTGRAVGELQRTPLETLVEEPNRVANRYEDCSAEYRTDGAEHFYSVTALDNNPGPDEEGAFGTAYTSMLRYGTSREPEGPLNVRLTHDTQSSRGLAWDAPRDPWLTTVKTARAGSGPQQVVTDPWTTGYRVERREYRRTEGGGWFLPEVEDEPIWSATMTVGSSSSGTGSTGYFGLGSNAYGVMTQTSFTHPVGSGSWEVTGLFVLGGELRLSIQEGAPLTDNLHTDAFEDWVLVVDGRSFPFELPEGVVGGNLQVSWPNHGLNWIDGQQVSLALVERLDWEALRDETDGDTDTSFTDSEDKGGKQYVYRVWAYNPRGLSLYSWRGDWVFNGGDPGGDPEPAVYIPSSPGLQQGGETPSNTPATGAPAISGTPQVGQTLTAGTAGIADEDGLTKVSYSYQWIAGGSDIDGATNSTYTLSDDDEGKAIRVRVSFIDDAGNQESLTSVATVAVAAAPNREATGQPAISGTPQVGQTLTAGTSGIADEDGLENVSYSYQWIAGGSDIDGATGSSYTLTSSEQGQTVQVRVTFTDDAENAESLISEATETVVQAPSPLTVSLENAATSHNGTDVFTFEIRFSEQFGLSYKTLRDDAFTVVGGEVKKAQRMDRDSDTPNIWWRITVEPDGNGDVTITLPATTDCTDDGAICTEDGRKLSNRLEFTVSGPGG